MGERNEAKQNEAKNVVTTIAHCVRCDGIHKDLAFSPLNGETVTGEMGDEYTHWAMCPTSKQPILLSIVPEPKKLAPRKIGKSDVFVAFPRGLWSRSGWLRLQLETSKEQAEAEDDENMVKAIDSIVRVTRIRPEKGVYMHRALCPVSGQTILLTEVQNKEGQRKVGKSDVFLTVPQKDWRLLQELFAHLSDMALEQDVEEAIDGLMTGVKLERTYAQEDPSRLLGARREA
jgi:hypothetical protein